MAFKYLQKNNLQEELNSSVGILAREKPEDLFYALGTHLHQLTKQPEIRASEYLKSDLPVRSPVNFVTHGKLHRSKIFFQNQESEVDIFYQRGEFEAVERDEKDEGEAEGSNNLNETESENLVRFEKLENYWMVLILA